MAVGFLFLLKPQNGCYREGFSDPVGIERSRTGGVIVAPGSIDCLLIAPILSIIVIDDVDVVIFRIAALVGIGILNIQTISAY